MSTPRLDSLQRMLDSGKDSAMLRYTLGSACLQQDDFAAAERHLRAALALDDGYSAAWKLLGKALSGAGDYQQAIAVFDRGIEVAEGRGDIQAAKEMRVFRRRAEKALQPA